MRSDHEFYQIFHRSPELLPCILPIAEGEVYSFESITLKQLERRLDGFVSSPEPGKRAFVVEYQVKPEQRIYPRFIVEVGVVQLRDMARPVTGVLVFASRESDNCPPGWGHIFTKGSPFVKIYLDERLSELGETHPLSATFGPFLEDNLDVIKAKAKGWYEAIQNSNLSSESKVNLESVFVLWLSHRLSNLSTQEVFEMLSVSIPFKESRLYKDVAADFEPIIEKERAARKKEQEARKKEQEARKNEQEARKEEQKAAVLNMHEEQVPVSKIEKFLSLSKAQIEGILKEAGKI